MSYPSPPRCVACGKVTGWWIETDGGRIPWCRHCRYAMGGLSDEEATVAVREMDEEMVERARPEIPDSAWATCPACQGSVEMKAHTTNGEFSFWQGACLCRLRDDLIYTFKALKGTNTMKPMITKFRPEVTHGR